MHASHAVSGTQRGHAPTPSISALADLVWISGFCATSTRRCARAFSSSGDPLRSSLLAGPVSVTPVVAAVVVFAGCDGCSGCGVGGGREAKGSVGGGRGVAGDAGTESGVPGVLLLVLLLLFVKFTVRRTCESAMGPRAAPVRHGLQAAAPVGVDGGARRHGSDGGSWAGAGAPLSLWAVGAADIARSLTHSRQQEEFLCLWKKKKGGLGEKEVKRKKEKKKWWMRTKETHAGDGKTTTTTAGRWTDAQTLIQYFLAASIIPVTNCCVSPARVLSVLSNATLMAARHLMTWSSVLFACSSLLSVG